MFPVSAWTGYYLEVSQDSTEELHAILDRLPRHDWVTSSRLLPENGIYFFYEQGEHARLQGATVARIVRVGTHRVNGRFPGRIRQHYGPARTLGGNKNGSVFRLHLGGAILRRGRPDDPRLPGWLTQMGPSFGEVEAEVSRVLRESFTFTCIRVNDPGERLSLERGLIALLAQYPLGMPSPSWLGQHAAAESIRCSGLWNTQHVDAQPMTASQFARFRGLAESSLMGASA